MRILIIQGHPAAAEGQRFDEAIAAAYARGATATGHEVRCITVAALEFPLLRSSADWEHGEVPADIRLAQADLLWAEHVVLVFPLWLGDMPALLKGFLEQILRPGFAVAEDRSPLKQPLKGRSAHIIVTMGMPALFYRLFYGAHAVKSLRRNILHFCGIKPVRTSYFGMVEGNSGQRRERFLRQLESWGRKAL